MTLDRGREMGISFGEVRIRTRPAKHSRLEAATRLAGNYLVRWRLFLSSYACLFAILAVRWAAHWAAHPYLVVAASVLSVLGLASLHGLTRATAQDASRDFIHIVSASDAGSDVAGYLASYLLPFVTTAFPGPWDLVSYSLFIAVVGVIYVRSDMVQINPSLYVLRYRVLKVTAHTTDGPNFSGFVISKRHLMPGDSLTAATLGRGIYVPTDTGDGS